jgi:hypothetical protein
MIAIGCFIFSALLVLLAVAVDTNHVLRDILEEVRAINRKR